VGTQGRVIVITGAMAAGKSTIAELLAQRLPRSVHVRGDVFRRMVVNGRSDMGPEASPDALAQLRLRYDLAAHAADRYADLGFDVVVQDVIIGPDLAAFVDRIQTARRYLVVLSPSVSALQEREDRRAKSGYVHFSAAALDKTLRRDTPRIGYWLDSTAQTPEDTVGDLLAHLDQASL
jgi:chloramphenicol 3-O-phosphotransferase